MVQWLNNAGEWADELLLVRYNVELYAEKVNNKGLCAIAQAESLSSLQASWWSCSEQVYTHNTIDYTSVHVKSISVLYVIIMWQFEYSF
jgi:hypothetical protein